MERNILKNSKIIILLIFILACAVVGTILFTPYMYEFRLGDTLSVNNSKTYSIDGIEYDVQIQNIEYDSQKTTFNVNGEEFAVFPGDAYHLADLTEVYLIGAGQDGVNFNIKTKIPTTLIWLIIPFSITWIILFFIVFIGSLYWNYFIIRFRNKIKTIDQSLLKPIFFQNPSRLFTFVFIINWHVLSFGFIDKNKTEKIMDDFFNFKEIRNLNNAEINKDMNQMFDMFYVFSICFVALAYGLLFIAGILVLVSS